MADIVNVAIDGTIDEYSVSVSNDLISVDNVIQDANESVNVTLEEGVVVIGDVVSINNIGDVTITNPQNGQTLKYDSSLSKWVNKTTEYKHNQNNAAETWTITHNLGLESYLPSVSIILSGGASYDNVQALGIVEYINENELTINFLSAKSGYAYIKI
jgi:hypothetical protein